MDINSIIIGLIVTIFSSILIWLVQRNFNKTDERASKIEDKVEDIEDKINPIVAAIKEIQGIIRDRLKTRIEFPLIMQGASPLKPTKIGKMYIKDSGLDKVLDKHKQLFADRIKGGLPKNHTDYDVQEISKQVLHSFKNDELMNEVKDYAYQNAIDIKMILEVGALWLRDDFLGQPRDSAEEQKND